MSASPRRPDAAPLVSILIPYREPDAGLAECLRGCAELEFRDFEILLLPDRTGPAVPGASAYATGAVTPAAKRNLGLGKARGGILAFLDADACPAPDWLTAALPLFADPAVAAVGGPNLTKLSDSLLERAGGEVLSSPACTGAFAARFGCGSFSTEDLPACNLLVRRSALTESGLLFDGTLLTGEDSKLCFDLKALGGKLVFARQVVVYHHRRRLFGPHLRQIWNYGRDKALVLRTHFTPGRAHYFLPAALVLATAAGLGASLAAGSPPALFAAALAAYLLAAAGAALAANWRHSPLIFPGIILTHYAYGLAFLCGLLVRPPRCAAAPQARRTAGGVEAA